MCILCVIQKWSRTVATVLPWLVIPLIGFWALSQFLPPAFRFEITWARLACVFVLLVTLLWYEILMPHISVWRAKNDVRVREKKRVEAIEMQKLRKSAIRRCRNCLTPYKDQNPGGGGKFMCSYCGHVSKRPVLDVPVPPGMGFSKSGMLKDLMVRGREMFTSKVWSDNGWMCGQDWLEDGSWDSGSFPKKSSYLSNEGRILGEGDHCLAEKSCSRVLLYLCKACKVFILCIIWVWRFFSRISSSKDDIMDSERRGSLDVRGEDAGNCQERKGEKARRKAEERRQARLEKELLEEEERMQREEVARLVEERRRLRDEKMEAEKECGKGTPSVKERDRKKEAERKRRERKKDKDRASSKSSSDAEELDKSADKDNERYGKCVNDRREHPRTGSENVKGYDTGVGHGHKVSVYSNHYRGNVGTRYLDRMKGSIFSSSQAFTGGGFFGRGTNVTSVSRESKSNSSVDHSQTSAYRRELSPMDCATGKPYMNGDEIKNINSRPVLIEPQPCTAPKKSWQQLFTRSSSVSPASPSNVIARPNGNSQPEVHTSQFSTAPPSTQAFNNPINFGLPSPFFLPSFSFGSTSNSTSMYLSSEAMFHRIEEKPAHFLPEESEIFEDPSNVPDPVSLLGPVSESLDNFQLDLGFVGDTALENPSTFKNIHAPPEVNRPSPIESPVSRLRVSEERHPISSLFHCTSNAQDAKHVPGDDLVDAKDIGTWQMWSSSPLGLDSLGLFGGSAKWFQPQEYNGTKKEDHAQPVQTMASLFKKDERTLFEGRSPHNNFTGNCQNGEIYNSVPPVSTEGLWLPNNYFVSTTANENQLSSKMEESTGKGIMHGSPLGSAHGSQFDISTANCWVKKEGEVPGLGDGIGKSSMMTPSITGLYSTVDTPSLWSHD